jgi:FtsZ-interacting cell division protein YlmF
MDELAKISSNYKMREPVNIELKMMEQEQSKSHIDLI